MHDAAVPAKTADGARFVFWGISMDLLYVHIKSCALKQAPIITSYTCRL